MLNKLRKELERLREEQEKERKKLEKDYFFTKEWELLKAQRERKNKGVKND
jgi:hypothetical protein